MILNMLQYTVGSLVRTVQHCTLRCLEWKTKTKRSSNKYRLRSRVARNRRFRAVAFWPFPFPPWAACTAAIMLCSWPGIARRDNAGGECSSCLLTALPEVKLPTAYIKRQHKLLCNGLPYGKDIRTRQPMSAQRAHL